MNKITVQEADIGCQACGASMAAQVSDAAAKAFVVGIVCALSTDQFTFCARHLATFRRTVELTQAPLPSVATTEKL